jgi:hypothetical protein
VSTDTLAARRNYWPAVPPTREERRISSEAFALARRHGLRFDAGVVEVYFSPALVDVGLRGQADWRGLPILVWIQTGLPARILTRTVVHELTHAWDALHDPHYDERSHEAIEGRCHNVADAVLALGGWWTPA